MTDHEKIAHHDTHDDFEKPSLDDQIEHTTEDLWTDPRITTFSVEEQKKIVWRIDVRLVLTLGFLYMISLMDRTNLGAANIAGYVLRLLLIA
jgi:hypothetical protein